MAAEGYGCDVCGAEPGRCMTSTICHQVRQRRESTAVSANLFAGRALYEYEQQAVELEDVAGRVALKRVENAMREAARMLRDVAQVAARATNDAKNAARYEWLRNHPKNGEKEWWPSVWMSREAGVTPLQALFLDDEIDNIMRREALDAHVGGL